MSTSFTQAGLPTKETSLLSQIHKTQRSKQESPEVILQNLQKQVHSLQELQTSYQSLLQGAEEGLVVLQQTRAVYVNRNFARFLGYKSAWEVLKIPTFFSIFEEKDANHLKKLINEAAFTPGQGVHTTCRCSKKDGSQVWFRMQIQSLNWRGQPSVLVSCTNTTTEKKSKEAMHSLYHVLKSAMDSLPISISVLDARDQLLFWNRGYEKEQGTLWAGKQAPAMLPAALHDTYTSDEGQETQLPNGEWKLIHQRPIDNGGKAVLQMDITAAKQQTAPADKTVQMLKNGMNALPLAVQMFDEKGVLLHWNQRSAEYFPSIKNSDIQIADINDMSEQMANALELSEPDKQAWIEARVEQFWQASKEMEHTRNNVEYEEMEQKLSNGKRVRFTDFVAEGGVHVAIQENIAEEQINVEQIQPPQPAQFAAPTEPLNWFGDGILQHCQQLKNQVEAQLQTLIFALRDDVKHKHMVKSVHKDYQQEGYLMNQLLNPQRSSTQMELGAPAVLNALPVLMGSGIKVKTVISKALHPVKMESHLFEELLLSLAARVKNAMQTHGGELLVKLENSAAHRLPQHLQQRLSADHYDGHYTKVSFRVKSAVINLEGIITQFPIPHLIAPHKRPTDGHMLSIKSKTKSAGSTGLQKHTRPSLFLNPEIANEVSMQQLQMWLHLHHGLSEMRHHPFHGIVISVYLPNEDNGESSPPPCVA